MSTAQGGCSLKPGKGFSQGTKTAGPFISNASASTTVRNKCPLLKPLRLWYLIIAAWAWTVGSYSNATFNFSRDCQTVFQHGCTLLHSHSRVWGRLFSPHPHQHLLLSIFLFVATLLGVKCFLIVILIVFPYWLMMLSIQTLSIFKFGSILPLMSSKYSSYILDTSLSCKYVSLSTGCPLTFLRIPLTDTSFKFWWRPIYLLFHCLLVFRVSDPRNHSPKIEKIYTHVFF